MTPENPSQMAPSLLAGPVWAFSLGLSSAGWTVVLVCTPIGIQSSGVLCRGVWTEHGTEGRVHRAPWGYDTEAEEGRKEMWNF